MQIELENCGRRFNKEWIFRNLNYSFNPGSKTAVLGQNGSGKSTLLSVLSGHMSTSEGSVFYEHEGAKIESEEIYSHISFSAPYIDLIEEFTLDEILKFHFNFKPLMQNLSLQEVPTLLGLEKSRNKALKYFSSGMRQRTRLALACFEQNSILMLDEPTANLDVQGIDWYQKIIQDFGENKMIIVASNQSHEYEFCHNFINIQDFKPSVSV